MDLNLSVQAPAILKMHLHHWHWWHHPPSSNKGIWKFLFWEENTLSTATTSIVTKTKQGTYVMNVNVHRNVVKKKITNDNTNQQQHGNLKISVLGRAHLPLSTTTKHWYHKQCEYKCYEKDRKWVKCLWQQGNLKVSLGKRTHSTMATIKHWYLLWWGSILLSKWSHKI